MRVRVKTNFSIHFEIDGENVLERKRSKKE